MKTLARLLVRLGVLPRSGPVMRFLVRELFVPLHPRDRASGIEGYFDLGANISPSEVDRFRAWFTKGGLTEAEAPNREWWRQ